MLTILGSSVRMPSFEEPTRDPDVWPPPPPRDPDVWPSPTTVDHKLVALLSLCTN